jgi:hypothetical protein
MPNPLNISPPPNNLEDLNHYSWRSWFMSVFNRIGRGPLGIQGYSKNSLPSASEWGVTTGDTFSSLIFVHDEAGGAVPCFSDGTNWRRVTDRAIVS